MSALLEQSVSFLNNQLGEATSVDASYKSHVDAATKLLDSVHAGLKKHAEKGNKNWGHVGDVEHVHKQLQNIHDMLHGSGEYAKK